MKEFWCRISEQLTALCLQLLERHPGKMLGVFAGFLAGLVVVLLGFWRTLVIMLFVAVGFYLGKRRDENKNFGQILQSLFGERK